MTTIVERQASATHSLFVIGTDTGVGKTHVCAALLRGLAARGVAAVGMKPVAAGATRDTTTGAWINDDVAMLRAASSVRVAPDLDNPILLPDPLSPHLAAQRAGIVIDLNVMVQAYRALSAQAGTVIVEGAGGFLVPLIERDDGRALTGADLALALGLPLLLVVGMRLGCLNHALLTDEAVRARNLTLHGWIANRIEPAMAGVEDNIAFLRRQITAPLLADLPFGYSGNLDIGWPP